jgi:ssDNA-binding Zn-finger/Zn-ribbon topoisomerase 1
MTDYDHTCPDCGGQMMRRTNKQTGQEFWGCLQYPSCTGTRNIQGDGKDDAAPEDLPSDRYRRADRHRWRN